MLILPNANFTFQQISCDHTMLQFYSLLYVSANHAHHTLPSPTTGTTGRRNTCSVIIDKLQILKADNEKDAISL